MQIDLVSFQISKDPVLHFKELAEDICRLIQGQDFQVVPYRNPELPYFTKLALKDQLRALAALHCQKEFFELAQTEELEYHSPQLLWRTLRKIKLTPPSDAFDKIAAEDMVEIYLKDGGSLFKNLRFYSLVSMSLEEIFCMKWHEQIRFSPQLLLFFMEVQTKFRLGHYRKGFVPHIVRRYTVTEKLGQKRRLQAQMKWVSPLAGTEQNAGLLVVSRANIAPSPNARKSSLR